MAVFTWVKGVHCEISSLIPDQYSHSMSTRSNTTRRDALATSRRGNVMNFSTLKVVFIFFLFLSPVTYSMDSCQQRLSAPCEQNHSIRDVQDAFDSLTHHGEWLGFRPGFISPIRLGGPEHIQGIARSHRKGVPYLFVTSAGHEDANLMVIRMASRDTTGERLRSNRLLRDVETDCTLPPTGDKVVSNLTFEDYNHPGTLAMVGDVLAIPFEQPIAAADSKGKISFYNVMGATTENSMPELIFDLVPVRETNSTEPDPAIPKRLVQEEAEGEEKMLDKGFGIIGLAKLPDGHFLLVTGAGVGSRIEFWRSNNTSFFADDKGQSEPFAFELHGVLYKQYSYEKESGTIIDVEDSPGLEDWFIAGGSSTNPPAFHTYQNYSLVNQDDGKLFMIVGRNAFAAAPYISGQDRIALYEVTGFEEGADIMLHNLRIEAQGIKNFSNDVILPLCTAGPVPGLLRTSNANLLAGGNTYVSPSGELLFYAVEHYNWGPTSVQNEDQRTVRMAELRHQQVVQEGSLTYAPTADPGNGYSVIEGSTVELDGNASRPASAAPWVQLFEHKGFQGQSVMFDYADRHEDDYDDFGELDSLAPLDLCYDPAELDALRADILPRLVDFTGLKKSDFTMNACLGVYVDQSTGQCYATPPLTGTENDLCRGGAVTAYGICHAGCVAAYPFSCTDQNCGCIDDCGTVRRAAYDVCDNGIPGPWVEVPDMLGGGWTIISLAKTHLPPTLAGLGDFVRTVNQCGRLGDVQLDPPPAPDFGVLTLNHYGITGSMSLFDIAEMIFFDFPNFTQNIWSAITEFTSYPGRLIAYVDDIGDRLSGFNNRASSLRWYVPDDMDAIVYQNAHHEGASLTLHGSGQVEEIADLDDESFNGTFDGVDDEIRSVRFNSSFTPSPIVSYMWSITSPTPASPYALEEPLTPSPIFDATMGDGPQVATVELSVLDSDMESGVAITDVDILNAPPVCHIEAITDETGEIVFSRIPDFPPGRTPVLLESLEYELAASFTDAGVLDTHTAEIDWGDGRSNRSHEAPFLLTDSIYGVTGTITTPTVYARKGLYPITLLVEDDDEGVGQDQLSVEVLDAAAALEVQIAALADTTYGAGIEDKHLLLALDMLRGKNGLERPALEMIILALSKVERAETREPGLELHYIKKRLALVAKSIVASVMIEAGADVKNASKLEKATLAMADGDENLSTGDYLEAAKKYLRTINGL